MDARRPRSAPGRRPHGRIPAAALVAAAILLAGCDLPGRSTGRSPTPGETFDCRDVGQGFVRRLQRNLEGPSRVEGAAAIDYDEGIWIVAAGYEGEVIALATDVDPQGSGSGPGNLVAANDAAEAKYRPPRYDDPAVLLEAAINDSAVAQAEACLAA